MNRPYKYISASVKGVERRINQDRIFIIENNRVSIFMLFDGVSSYSSSYLFIEKYVDILRSKNEESEINGTNLSEVLFDTHSAILKMDTPGMSTLSLFCRSPSFKGKGYIINIGDSGIYALTNRSFEKITHDDALPGYLNVLTRCLGMNSLSLKDFTGREINIPPKILLCTDGFSNLMKENKQEYFRVFNFKRPGFIKRKISDLQRGHNADDASYILIQNHVSD